MHQENSKHLRSPKKKAKQSHIRTANPKSVAYGKLVLSYT